MEEDTHGLGAIEDHMSPWGVIEKEICYCLFMLGFKVEGTLINHKPSSYD